MSKPKNVLIIDEAVTEGSAVCKVKVADTNIGYEVIEYKNLNTNNVMQLFEVSNDANKSGTAASRLGESDPKEKD